jgi:hypothetical protein
MSSKPATNFISGVPDIVKYANFLSKEYAKALSTAIRKAEQNEKKLLKKEASTSVNDWVNFADDLTVEYVPEEGVFKYGIVSTADTSSASALEYGTGETSAQPLLRSTAKGREEDLGKYIDEELSKKLKKMYK